MSFWAKSFVFDSVPSETYGLFLISDGASGVLSNIGSSSVEIYSQTLYRKPKPYFFGTQQTPILSFELTFASLTPISAISQQYIQKWLFGHAQYKKLQIMQCDMDNVYFNCVLTSPVITTVGNFAYSFKCTVMCDSPWGWEYPQVKSYTLQSGSSIDIKINNTSDDNYYTFPKITMTSDYNGGQISIRNQSDNERGFLLTGITADEIITMDSNLYTIKSNKQLLHLDDMNGNFIRLVQGLNTLKVEGDIVKLVIEYQAARKVSG